MSALYLSSVGADLKEIEPHTRELGKVVEEMKKKLVTEVRVLEGTEVESYLTVRTALENELSTTKLTEEQWKSALPSGCSTTDPIPDSNEDSETSSCFAGLLNHDCRFVFLSNRSTPSPTDSCSGKSADCGCETGATNAYCECMERTTSGQRPGTPNEVK
jgi:hypothetical protein